MAKTYHEYQSEAGFNGPYKMEHAVIGTIGDDTYGAYILVCTGKKGGTIVIYVGRGILKDRLTAHLDGHKDAKSFYFKVLQTDQEGFAEECRLFHKYGKCPYLDNEIHPAVPGGTPQNAPRCSEPGCNGGPN